MATDALRAASFPARSAPMVARAAGPGIRPVAALRAAVLAMVLGNLGRIPLISSGAKDAPLLVNEILVAVVLLLGAVACVQARSFRLDRLALIALAFAGVGAASAVIAGIKFDLPATQVAFGLAYLARWLAYFGVYVVILNTARRADASSLWRALESGMLAFALFGIVQAIFLPGFAQLVFPETGSSMQWDRQGHRLVSTILDPNFAGALVLLPLLVLLARVTYGVRERPWKLVVLFAALLMTVSRSSMLALVVGCLVIAVARGLNRRLVRALLVAAVLLVPFVPLLVRFAASFNKFSIDGSALARTVSWLRALTVLADNPMLGVGFNTYGFVQAAYGFDANRSFALDGGVLFIAVMTGTVGVVLYGAMIGTAVARCRRLWRDVSRAGEERGLALGTGAATIALIVHSVFVNSLLLPFVMESLWLLWGITFVLSRPASRVGVAPQAVHEAEAV